MFAQDYRDRIRALVLPTLVVHGARSRFYRAETSRFIARIVADGRVVAFDHSGHAPHLEEPDAFNALLKRFVTEIRNAVTEAPDQAEIVSNGAPTHGS